MALTKLNLDLDPAMFAEHGVDVNEYASAKEKAESRNKAMDKRRNQQNQRNKANAVWAKSLWASGEIQFAFNDWKPNERQNTAKARNLGNKAFKLAKEMVNSHFNVIMSGDAGVGKTSLALAMLDQLRKQGKEVLFVSTVALSQLVAEQYNYQDKRSRLHDLTRAMRTCDVLLLDDLGADGGSAEKVMGQGYTGTRKDLQALLFDIANNRYEGTAKERRQANKDGLKLIKPVHQTIITTNNLTEELRRIYGERTISRLVSLDPNHRLAFNDMEDMRTKEGI